ncbi:hypothetical protein, partial [Burkholderia pseudomallei]|uniref:hypothetical protein n=1 Tax=Burkholderia pseudomallei TaxID=28450 RepID=UPI0027E54789
MVIRDSDSEAIELVADERPVDVEVDSEARLLSVVLKPVESEPMPVEVDVDNEATELLAELLPDEVDVDSEVNELFVLLSPPDSDASELFAYDRPVDADVEHEVRC